MSSLNPFKSSSSDQARIIEPTSAEKALNFERGAMWNDVKDRFWPMDVEAFEQGEKVEVGRKSREEQAIGATPLGYNRYGGGVAGDPGGAASGAAARMGGLRQNEQDRKQANTVNTIRNQREIQGQGLSEMAGSAGLQNKANLSRYASQHAATLGIQQGIGQMGATAAGYFATQPSQQQAAGINQPYAYNAPNYNQYGNIA